MCGRFARYSLSRELERFFNAHPPDFEIQPNYNVAPTQEIPVIVIHENERHIKKRHWGLVPFWAKDITIGSRMINARVETVTSKPAFRAALKQRRCLIPADGFNEWKKRQESAIAGLKSAPRGGGNPRPRHTNLKRPYKKCGLLFMAKKVQRPNVLFA